jgi:hypothetical protein
MDMVMEKDMDIGYWYIKKIRYGITSNFALYRIDDSDRFSLLLYIHHGYRTESPPTEKMSGDWETKMGMGEPK